jgi:hypothetical protein
MRAMRGMMRATMAAAAGGALALGLVAGPAFAETKPINGNMYLEFVGPVDDCDLGGGVRTWVGTVEIDGATYGWADFSTGAWFEGKFFHFTEYWTIFDTDDPGDLAADSCDPGLVLLAGTNTGWGPPGMTAKADGVVETATGPFADVEPGSRMFWRGKVLDEAQTLFKATLHIGG